MGKDKGEDEVDDGGDNEPELDEQESDDTGSAPASPGKADMQLHEDHIGDPEYKQNFTTLYPFSSVDFFVSETRETGLGNVGTKENVVTKKREDHYYAEPAECNICEEQNAKIAELERENWKL